MDLCFPVGLHFIPVTARKSGPNPKTLRDEEDVSVRWLLDPDVAEVDRLARLDVVARTNTEDRRIGFRSIPVCHIRRTTDFLANWGLFSSLFWIASVKVRAFRG
jgi:hypothetical protein